MSGSESFKEIEKTAAGAESSGGGLSALDVMMHPGVFAKNTGDVSGLLPNLSTEMRMGAPLAQGAEHAIQEAATAFKGNAGFAATRNAIAQAGKF